MRETRVHLFPCVDEPTPKPFEWTKRQWSTTREDRASRALQAGQDYAQNRPSQGSKNHHRDRARKARSAFERDVVKALRNAKSAESIAVMENRIEFTTDDLKASLTKLKTRWEGKAMNRKARHKLKSLQDQIATKTDRISSYY